MAELMSAFDSQAASYWARLAAKINSGSLRTEKVIDHLEGGSRGATYSELKEHLIYENPHAIYPTSPYRSGEGHVVANSDFTQVDAVMESKTFTTVKIVDNVLDPQEHLLSDYYKPAGRCVCLIDTNVEEAYGKRFDAYFAAHGITLEKLVYRAMEVDKGIHTVEKMLGDFKRLGVSRNEAVLIAGGGVLADTGGLACALYHRSTPYIMLSTSIVSGIDAGPSPRTCCDGFGYKNLFGAYHAPIISITDRTFFSSLPEGWLRHGIAEIIKMGTVKDEALFADLERGGKDLITTRFGTLDTAVDSPIQDISKRVIGRAIQSYVASEYGNLYETHQARPHAFGHTWSPGFEIQAGLLHGHAVSIGMGFGAFLSNERGWIGDAEMERVFRLIRTFGLSLAHPILEDTELIWQAQVKMVEKRGGHLAAPVPRGVIGDVGYIEKMSRSELRDSLRAYSELCKQFPNDGIGTDPHCADVGLEDPSTVATPLAAAA